MRVHPLLFTCALLTVLAANAPHADAQPGRWSQAFRHTGSQAMKSPGYPHINTNPVDSPFDLSSQTADFGWYSYPNYALSYPTAPWSLYTTPHPPYYPVSPLHYGYGRWNTLFPFAQSFSVQQFSIQITPPQLVTAPSPTAADFAQNPLQPAPIPLAFDPADPQLLNFAAPARAAAVNKRPHPNPGLPGVAAQPVPDDAEQGIVLRGKRKLADGRK